MTLKISDSTGVAYNTSFPPLTLSDEEIRTVYTLADNIGIRVAIDKVKSIAGDLDSSSLAAYTIAILEKIASTSKKKVWNYISFSGDTLYLNLPITVQKVEMVVRLTKLLELNERSNSRKLAFSILSSNEDDIESLPRNIQFDMAILKAEEGDYSTCIKMLKALKSPSLMWDECKRVAHVFYESGFFDQGLMVIESFKEIKIAGSEEHQDFVELISQLLKDRNVLNEIDFRESLIAHQDTYKKTVMISKALCHIGDIQIAINLTAEYALKHKSMNSLFSIKKYAENEPALYDRYLEVLKETTDALHMELKLKMVALSQEVCLNPDFTVAEILEHIKNSEIDVEYKLDVLVERLAMLKNKQISDPSLGDDIVTILSVMRELLKQTKNNVGMNHPVWVKVIREYFILRHFDEVIKVSQEWKEWFQGLNWRSWDVSKHYGKLEMLLLANEFLSYSGITKLGMNYIAEGLEDLKMAYEFQQEEWQMNEGVTTNNFWYYTKFAINDLFGAFSSGALVNSLKDEFFSSWKRLGTDLSFLDIEAAVRAPMQADNGN
jgi:hypothetical protein